MRPTPLPHHQESEADHVVKLHSGMEGYAVTNSATVFDSDFIHNPGVANTGRVVNDGDTPPTHHAVGEHSHRQAVFVEWSALSPDRVWSCWDRVHSWSWFDGLRGFVPPDTSLWQKAEIG